MPLEYIAKRQEPAITEEFKKEVEKARNATLDVGFAHTRSHGSLVTLEFSQSLKAYVMTPLEAREIAAALESVANMAEGKKPS